MTTELDMQRGPNFAFSIHHLFIQTFLTEYLQCVNLNNKGQIYSSSDHFWWTEIGIQETNLAPKHIKMAEMYFHVKLKSHVLDVN